MPWFWIGRVNIVKIIVLPKEFYRINAISIKLPMVFYAYVKQNLKILYGKTKDPK